jgi:hypothetical protein
VALVVECLSSKHRTPSSNPSTAKVKWVTNCLSIDNPNSRSRLEPFTHR